MFTVRLILVGLIALTPHPDSNGNGMVAVLPDAGALGLPEHQPWVLLWEGECEGHACGGGQAPFEHFKLAWKLNDHDVSLRTYLEQQGWLKATGREGNEPAPNEANDNGDFSWIPDVSWLISNAKLPWVCFNDPASCSILGRIFLEQGKISSCHFIHDEDGKLGIFKAPPNGSGSKMPQVVANAAELVLHLDDEVGLVTLHRGSFVADSTENAVLRPVDGVLTLVILNEPLNGTSSGDKLEHFKAFYSLVNGSLEVPSLDSWTSSEHGLGTCEEDLQGIASCIKQKNCTSKPRFSNPMPPRMAPHGPSECDLAYIP